jgi:hypothetical protein
MSAEPDHSSRGRLSRKISPTDALGHHCQGARHLLTGAGEDAPDTVSLAWARINQRPVEIATNDVSGVEVEA